MDLHDLENEICMIVIWDISNFEETRKKKQSYPSSTILRLWEALEQEPMLAATSEDQRQEARKAVERAIFSEVHINSRKALDHDCGMLDFDVTINICRSTWRHCTPTRRQTCRGTWCCSSTLVGFPRWSVPTTGTSRFLGGTSTSVLGQLLR